MGTEDKTSRNCTIWGETKGVERQHSKQKERTRRQEFQGSLGSGEFQDGTVGSVRDTSQQFIDVN